MHRGDLIERHGQLFVWVGRAGSEEWYCPLSAFSFVADQFDRLHPAWPVRLWRVLSRPFRRSSRLEQALQAVRREPL